jgi:REP-associated tyrosine transposase
MSTYTQILYQLVFSTKGREKTLIETGQEKLCRYITGVLKNKVCHLYRINALEDHIHIATHIHSSIALANLIKDIKLSASDLIKEKRLFPRFAGWQTGYGAFTYSISAKENLIQYIMNQKEHHKKITFREEFIKLLKDHNIKYDARYLL